ncbi:MAG: DHHW family protein [Bacillota bacterium]
MRVHKLNIIVFCIVVFAVSVFNIIYFNNDLYSEAENRRLAEFPEFNRSTYFSGRLAEGIDEYLADRFMFRDRIVSFTYSLRNLRGYKPDEGVIIHQSGGFNEGGDPADIQVQEIEFGETDTAKIVLMKDRGFTAYKLNEDSIQYYAQSLNKLAELIGELELDVLIAPSQAYFVDKRYQKYTDDQYSAMKMLKNNINPEVKLIDVFKQLKNHRAENIYFRTDHHWTGLGAYYAYLEACKILDIKTTSLKEYEQIEIKDFVGSIYNMTQYEELKKKPDSFTVYKPETKLSYEIRYAIEDKEVTEVFDTIIKTEFAEAEYKYNAFLFGDFGYSKIMTENADKENLLIIKDSYGNALIPFLVNQYYNIVMIDPRKYNESLLELIENEKIDRVLIINSAQILSKTTYMNKLNDIMR